MPCAPGNRRAARISRRLGLLVALTCAIPLLILGYVIYGLVLPRLDPIDTGRLLAVQVLALAAGIGVAAGGWAMTTLGRGARREGPADPAGADTSALAESLARAQAIIDRQASEIAAFQGRLEEAYKDLETTNARLKETSFKDEVTGLYNRRFFTVRLEEELSRHRRFNHPVAIVLFDLDGFKAVNDEQGHAVGDETLRDIGQILMKHSRGINVVSRYGGDEFAILLVETSKAGARLYADRIRQIISSYPYSHGKRITASFGVASLPDDDAHTAEDLVRAADEALYIAKRAGKNQVAGAQPSERVP